MNLMYREKQKVKHDSGILSAVRPNEAKLELNSNSKTQLQTELKLKKRLKVYIEDDKYLIEHSAAHALGIIKTRAIMLNEPKLVEISKDMHARLKNNHDIEIEYEQIKQEKEKLKLKVFEDGSNYCIQMSAAYGLGYINIQEFFASKEEYFYISKEMLAELKNKFDIEMSSIQLTDSIGNKNVIK